MSITRAWKRIERYMSQHLTGAWGTETCRDQSNLEIWGDAGNERKFSTKLAFPTVCGQGGKKFDKQRQEGKSKGMWRRRNLLTRCPRLKGNRWGSIIVERKARCWRPIQDSAWNRVMSTPNPLAALGTTGFLTLFVCLSGHSRNFCVLLQPSAWGWWARRIRPTFPGTVFLPFGWNCWGQGPLASSCEVNFWKGCFSNIENNFGFSGHRNLVKFVDVSYFFGPKDSLDRGKFTRYAVRAWKRKPE